MNRVGNCGRTRIPAHGLSVLSAAGTTARAVVCWFDQTLNGGGLTPGIDPQWNAAKVAS